MTHITETGATPGPGRWSNLSDDEFMRYSAYSRGYADAVADKLQQQIDEIRARQRRKPWWKCW